MHRVDTHIITLQGWGGQRDAWYEQCLASLENEPTNIHIIEGYEGHIGKGRADGFASGDAEFVSFVDPDDYVEPGVYQKAIDYLDANPNIDIICTNENVIDEDGSYKRTHRHANLRKEFIHFSLLHIHHLVVARREAIEPYDQFLRDRPIRCEFSLWFEMYKDGKKFEILDYVGYNWRTHENSSHKLLQPNEREARRMQMVFNSLEGL